MYTLPIGFKVYCFSLCIVGVWEPHMQDQVIAKKVDVLSIKLPTLLLRYFMNTYQTITIFIQLQYRQNISTWGARTHLMVAGEYNPWMIMESRRPLFPKSWSLLAPKSMLYSLHLFSLVEFTTSSLEVPRSVK